MKKITAVFLSALILISFSVMTFAADGEGDIIRVTDYEMILSEKELKDLEKETGNLFQNYGYDVFCVLTENASDDYMYSYNIYSQATQYTERYDSVVIVISADNHVYTVTPFGSAGDVITDEVIAEALELSHDSVDKGNYYNAFKIIIKECEKYLKDSDHDLVDTLKEENPDATENVNPEEKPGLGNKTVFIAAGAVVIFIVAIIFAVKRKKK